MTDEKWKSATGHAISSRETDQLTKPPENVTCGDVSNVGEALDASIRLEDIWFNCKEHTDLELKVLFETIKRALAQQQPDDAWQPIESAPRDGRPILVSITNPKSGDSWQDVVCFNDIENQFMAGSMFVGHDFITHWMPLPETRRAEQKGGV